MNIRELKASIECELAGTDGLMAGADSGFSALRTRLDAAGFTPEQAHMLAAAPQLLTQTFELLSTLDSQEGTDGR